MVSMSLKGHGGGGGERGDPQGIKGLLDPPPHTSPPKDSCILTGTCLPSKEKVNLITYMQNYGFYQ